MSAQLTRVKPPRGQGLGFTVNGLWFVVWGVGLRYEGLGLE